MRRISTPDKYSSAAGVVGKVLIISSILVEEFRGVLRALGHEMRLK